MSHLEDNKESRACNSGWCFSMDSASLIGIEGSWYSVLDMDELSLELIFLWESGMCGKIMGDD